MFVAQIFYIVAKKFGARIDPGMFVVGDAMKLEDSDAAIFGLGDGAFEIFEGPGGPTIAGGGNQERVIDARFESKAATLFVGIFRGSAASGEANAHFVENCKCFGRDAVAGPGK